MDAGCLEVYSELGETLRAFRQVRDIVFCLNRAINISPLCGESPRVDSQPTSCRLSYRRRAFQTPQCLLCRPCLLLSPRRRPSVLLPSCPRPKGYWLWLKDCQTSV